jgi:hypothetical protein
MGRVSLALMFWLAGSAFGWCQTSVMQFAAYPPDQWSEKLMGDHTHGEYLRPEKSTRMRERGWPPLLLLSTSRGPHFYTSIHPAEASQAAWRSGG